MIRSFRIEGDRLTPLPGTAPDSTAQDGRPCWFDLSSPTPQERAALADHLGIDLPTRDDMAEIEVSSRLYSEDGAEFMTALIPAGGDSDDITLQPVTFILSRRHLITIRHHDPSSFNTFTQRAVKPGNGFVDGETALLALLEAIIDRLADILERAARDIERLSREVFREKDADAHAGGDYKSTLHRIGRAGDLTSNMRDSLVTLERLIAFLTARLKTDTAAARGQVRVLAQDVRSLQDHAGFMSQKVTFLLDATLGLVNIEQAGIIKIFSVVSVIFLPPTLVASIYGMNFDIMPELHWAIGYPWALVMMVLSAVLPFAYFKRRGWL